MKKELKDKWVVIDRDGNPKVYSIANTISTSTNLFCMETGEAWLNAARNGYECVNVTITFERTN